MKMQELNLRMEANYIHAPAIKCDVWDPLSIIISSHAPSYILDGDDCQIRCFASILDKFDLKIALSSAVLEVLYIARCDAHSFSNIVTSAVLYLSKPTTIWHHFDTTLYTPIGI